MLIIGHQLQLHVLVITGDDEEDGGREGEEEAISDQAARMIYSDVFMVEIQDCVEILQILDKISVQFDK